MPLSEPQRQVADSAARWRVLVSGRRFGKTTLAIRELARHARYPSKVVWYVAPTYRQAKQIAWAMLKNKLIEFRWARAFNEQDLSAVLRNGSIIALRGADKPDSLRGVGLDFIALDEVADIKQSAWIDVLRPTLADSQGSALFLGTPKGLNWFHDLWMHGQNHDPGWESWQFTTLEGGNVPEDEVEAARHEMDELSFQAEFLASFVLISGRAYYPFDSRTHCANLTYDPRQPLVFCFDFNVAPGVAAICQEQRLPNGLDGTGVIGEVHIPRNSNTIAVCQRLIADWGKHEGRVLCYGDATGGARGSAKVAGSDWDLIKEMLRPVFGSRLAFKVPQANPAERSRINAVNSRLKSAAGDIRIMVDPAKAPHVVKDFEGVVLLEGGSGELDKQATPELTHLSDAVGGYIAAEFPLTDQRIIMRKISGF